MKEMVRLDTLRAHPLHCDGVAEALDGGPPWTVDVEEAAALPSAALTAPSGLRQFGDLGGRQLLVVGATGGVGHMATQFSRLRGARVTAVCSELNRALAKTLGAEAVIDYRARPILAQGESYDMIYNAADKLKFADARAHLRAGGVNCTTAEGGRPWPSQRSAS